MAGKDDQVQRAKLAEQAERYDDMATAMKKVKEPRLSFLRLNFVVSENRRFYSGLKPRSLSRVRL